MFFLLREKLKSNWNLPKIYWGSHSYPLIFLKKKKKKDHFIGVAKTQRALHLLQLSQWFGNYQPFTIQFLSLYQGKLNKKWPFCYYSVVREKPHLSSSVIQHNYCAAKAAKTARLVKVIFNCSPNTSQFNLLAHLKTCQGYAVIWESSHRAHSTLGRKLFIKCKNKSFSRCSWRANRHPYTTYSEAEMWNTFYD